MSIDFIVTAKRDYEGELTHLKVMEIRDDEAMSPEAKSRERVVKEIFEDNAVYYLASPNDEGGYTIGRKLRVVEDATGRYLRIDEESTPEDRLGRLPNF